jgi:hypothetical protein
MSVSLSPAEWAELARQRSVVGDDGCWHWLGSIINGVPVIQVKRKRYRIARLVAGLPRSRFVELTCGSADCVNPAHIRSVTRSYYVRRDSPHRRPLTFVQRRLVRKRSGLCKLDEAKAAEIRRQWSAGVSLRAIAQPLGVHYETVRSVVLGRSWREPSPWAI